MKIFVNVNAPQFGDGSEKYPLRSIAKAAAIARPGDEVIVSPGIYREYVDPVCAGTEEARIVYRSEIPCGAVITGAEEVKNWTPYPGNDTVYVARIPNAVFGAYNPYTTKVFGDWFDAHYLAHTGEVFLNDKSLYEVSELDGVLNPVVYGKSWDPEFTVYTWYAEQDEAADETVIYANFQGADPNQENVEINVRENCFYPSKEGVGYITLSGFKICKAATQWAPPTAYQEGMIGPHWSKGWIIEDCEVSHSKCSGISLGKYKQPNNDNKWSLWKYKDGTQTERDNICQAQIEGWTKERIGSHIIRRCNIHDCGQTGIVGHLGGVFSVIEYNHIHHINNKMNLAGAEIGGIKMHAAIDVIYRGNHIHHCTRGLWLDWQAQGTRVTQNLFHDNTFIGADHDYSDNINAGEDIFIEVSHGPTLVDNNILLSDFALKLPTQGVALVHNLISGSITAVGRGVNNGSITMKSPRYTPYHVPHRTEIMGFMTILHGDAKIYNNVFVQHEVQKGITKFFEIFKDNEWTDANPVAGTLPYDSYPTIEEYKTMFEGYCGMGSPASDRYYSKLPVWAGGNVYLGGAKAMAKETDAYVDETPVSIELEYRDGKPYLKTDLFEKLPKDAKAVICTETLGIAFEPEEKYENPDGTPIVFDTDYFGKSRGFAPIAGPFAAGTAACDGALEVWG